MLNIDSVAVVEHLTGENFQVLPLDTQALGLGLELNKNAAIHKLMIDSGDFSFGDTYDRRRSILEREGFECVHAVQFNPGRWEDKLQPDRLFSIWVNAEHGLVLTQPTYTFFNEDGSIGETCDHAKCYFCWEPYDFKNIGVIGLGSGGWESPKFPKWRSMDPPEGSKEMFFTPDDLYFRGYHTGDRAIIHRLQHMLIRGRFMSSWPEWSDGKTPLMGVFCTALDYKSGSGPDDLERLSKVSCQVYDSLPVLHPIMNIKPTWRKA